MLRAELDEYEAELIIIDPWVSFIPPDTCVKDSNSKRDQSWSCWPEHHARDLNPTLSLRFGVQWNSYEVVNFKESEAQPLPEALGKAFARLQSLALHDDFSSVQKTPVIPISTVLYDELANAPPHSAATLLASSKGTPWTYDGFASGWQRLRRKLEAADAIAPGLTP
jgi:hypothetical protein